MSNKESTMATSSGSVQRRNDTGHRIKTEDIHSRIQAELAHIPDWPEPQRDLRMLYEIKRLRSLGKRATLKKTASEVLAESIGHLKVNYPGYEFRYDSDFFAETSQQAGANP